MLFQTVALIAKNDPIPITKSGTDYNRVRFYANVDYYDSTTGSFSLSELSSFLVKENCKRSSSSANVNKKDFQIQVTTDQMEATDISSDCISQNATIEIYGHWKSNGMVDAFKIKQIDNPEYLHDPYLVKSMIKTARVYGTAARRS